MSKYFSLCFFLAILSLQVLGQSSGKVVKCYTPTLMKQLWEENPTLYERYQRENQLLKDSVLPQLRQRFNKTSGIHYTIPVVVHVMHENGPENISYEQIKSQITVLNEDFGRYGNGSNAIAVGADTRIRFCLAQKDPAGNPTNGIDRVYYPKTDSFSPNMDSAMKSLSIWDPERYLNIWVLGSIYASQNTDSTQVAGYSYYPAAKAGTNTDGLVIRYDFFGRVGEQASPSLNGRTTTHEVGHYLNLLHPWGNGGCDEDDEVDDTPNCKGPFYAQYPDCPHPEECGQTRMIENYMDYSGDKCMNTFTQGQALRMRAAVAQFRAKLVSAANLSATGCHDEDSINQVSPENDLTIYPNPARDKVLIFPDMDTVEQYTVTIHNSMGQLVHTEQKQKIKGGVYILGFSDRAPGLYIIQVQVNGISRTRKLIITR